MSTLNFKTTGLHCSSCSMLVEMTLGDITGVDSVSCAHATGLTAVTYDPAVVSPDSIFEAVRSTGYEVEPVA